MEDRLAILSYLHLSRLMLLNFSAGATRGESVALFIRSNQVSLILGLPRSRSYKSLERICLVYNCWTTLFVDLICSGIKVAGHVSPDEEKGCGTSLQRVNAKHAQVCILDLDVRP